MAQAIPLPNPEATTPRLRFPWRRRGSLTTRILMVNLIVLVLLAGSLFYLDSYRNQLIEERFKLARSEVEIIADALAETPSSERRALLARIAGQQKLRLRLYDIKSQLTLDTFQIADPAFTFADPSREPWYQDAARALDTGMDFILGKDEVPPYRDPSPDRAAAWPELQTAQQQGQTAVAHRAAPDRTPVLTAAVPVGIRGELLLSTRNASDITQRVRDARQTLANVILVALLLSIYLSLFLGRTIVRPLRELVRAAIRVRLGRDRAVVVPRLPDRRDEIGLLARAISDMSLALRQRIDAVEAFAADVAHEIKNPLASLRSALEALDKVEDPKLRHQLAGIAQHDVQRIDRLVTEIADASRIDAELSRTQFEPVEVGALLKQLVNARSTRGVDGSCKVQLKLPRGSWLIEGDIPRLERVFDNLLDNAVSFSPEGGAIEIAVEGDAEQVRIAVSDEGPGIPTDARDKVFERFHSLRPDGEDFGRHSGLGLAIARTIIAAHDGTLSAADRSDGKPGARLIVELPLAEPEE
jgi:two-component system sensor histidine kinase ChvG